MGSVITAADLFLPEGSKEWGCILISLASPGVGKSMCCSGACLGRCCALRDTTESKDFCVKKQHSDLFFHSTEKRHKSLSALVVGANFTFQGEKSRAAGISA